MKGQFTIWDGLIGINDSMELDSGQSVAELKLAGDLSVEIRVEGDVRVVWEDEVYRTPSDFPDELKDIFHNGGYGYKDENQRLFVDNNNWFEIFIYRRGVWTGWSDVIDADWTSAGDILNSMLDYANEYLKTE